MISENTDEHQFNKYNKILFQIDVKNRLLHLENLCSLSKIKMGCQLNEGRLLEFPVMIKIKKIKYTNTQITYFCV